MKRRAAPREDNVTAAWMVPRRIAPIAESRTVLFAGVPIRHLELRFAFLDGEVAWAASLSAQLMLDFTKRNADAIWHRRRSPATPPARSGTAGAEHALRRHAR